MVKVENGRDGVENRIIQVGIAWRFLGGVVVMTP
jgi:hypothetical protein